MKKIVNYLTIHEEFVCEGETNEMKERIQRINGATLKPLSDDEVKLSANSSAGIAMSGGIGLSIYVRILLAELEPGLMKVTIKSDVRPEHYAIVILFLFFFFGVAFSPASKWFLLLVLGLWPIVQLWFRFVYRYQEYLLVDKVIGKLGMKRIKKSK